MINIKQCVSCENYHTDLHGPCPIWFQIQEGMRDISEAMLRAYGQKGLLSVVVKGHWLASCEFECKFRKEANPNG